VAGKGGIDPAGGDASAAAHPPARRLLGPRPWILLAAGLVLALVAGAVGGWIAALTSRSRVTGCSAQTIADTVLPTVVTISVRSGTSTGSGSGAVIRNGGYVLTNDHVIALAGNGGDIAVLFSGGQQEPARLVGRSTRLDLAVLQVAAAKPLPTIEIGRANSLRVGQPVVALGAPLGLSGTVTTGIVSALGRDVPVPVGNGGTAVLPGTIQTDAAINPGNSGGPLVNCAGSLIGVNTAIATVPNETGQAGGGSVGIGFAIPVDLAAGVADQIIATGAFSGPFFGVSTAPIPAAMAARFGVPAGLYVQAIANDGPAAKGGLQAGDVITRVDGQATTGPDSLFTITVAKKAGDRVPVEFVRGGRSQTTDVTLAEQP
jgi:putative serine protease PepD